MSIRDTVTGFYLSLAAGNDEWKKHLSEGVTFSDASNRLHAEGKAAFIQSFTAFLHAVEGVRLKQLIVEGEDAAAVVSYDYVSPKGERLHQDDAEVWKVVDGVVVALTIYFDITEFRSFMGR